MGWEAGAMRGRVSGEEWQEQDWPCSRNDMRISTPDDMEVKNKVMVKDEVSRTPKKKKKK